MKEFACLLKSWMWDQIVKGIIEDNPPRAWEEEKSGERQENGWREEEKQLQSNVD